MTDGMHFGPKTWFSVQHLTETQSAHISFMYYTMVVLVGKETEVSWYAVMAPSTWVMATFKRDSRILEEE